MSSWKDVMRQQHDDLERMEAMDAALNTEQVTAEVDRVLKKPTSFGLFSGRTGSSSSSSSSGAGGSSSSSRPSVRAAELDFASLDLNDLGAAPQANDDDEEAAGGRGGALPLTARSGKSAATRTFGSSRRGGGAPASPGGATPPASAPDAQARYAKAKVKQLEAALEESEAVRLKVNEQLAEAKRMLLSEREEGKKLKNRVKLLEIENRKGGAAGRRGGEAGTGPGAGGGAGPGEDSQLDSLKQEIDLLRKDLGTAERLAKAAEASAKAKETQLNRTAEIVARQKKQLEALQGAEVGSRDTERARADAAEARVKTLEKQRAELVAGFKKQMKLIDNLKRQKLHIEAARVLAFTEEEFLRLLDWTA